MKSQDIVFKLFEMLPKFSDSYSSFYTPESVSINPVGNVVTVGQVGHGFVANQLVPIVGAKFTNDVVSVEVTDTNAVITTTTETDFAIEEFEPTMCRLSSVLVPEVNGSYQVIEMESGTVFTISDYTYTGTMPADLQVIEDRPCGINGLQTVTVIDVDNFSFENYFSIDSGLGVFLDEMQIHYDVRISRAGSIKRAIAAYNSQPPAKLNISVVLGDTGINKDAETYSDDSLEQGGQNEWEGMLQTPFHVYVFHTIKDDPLAGKARDNMIDVRADLYSSLLGVEFESETVAGTVNAVYPVGDSEYEYQKGYYVHDFEFSQTLMISREDTNDSDKTRAIKNITFKLQNDNSVSIITGSVDLRE